MSYPIRKQIYNLFLHLRDPPSGVQKFFAQVDDNVRFEVTGQHQFSGVWTTKENYFAATWSRIGKYLAEPGYRLEVVGEEKGVITVQDGWAAVELKTFDTNTRSGKPYEQHYSWHCRFGTSGKIAEVRAFLDSEKLVKIIEEEEKIADV